jgi:hypothetical protein
VLNSIRSGPNNKGVTNNTIKYAVGFEINIGNIINIIFSIITGIDVYQFFHPIKKEFLVLPK